MALLNRERSRPRDRAPMGSLNAGVPAPGLGSHEAPQNAGKRGGDDVLEARPVRRRVDNTPSALNAGRSKQKFGAAVGWAHVVLACASRPYSIGTMVSIIGPPGEAMEELDSPYHRCAPAEPSDSDRVP
ncbi:hypothetical protein THAOC_28431 [Thalassiosira oceanica]|uniref:Uncharacterized protein n=1 Tax=Thalassiosira oceanica TaxID=159749 RepID=K0RJ42_THAOC|nr:hypothetical protein THAOC_28431 [Thalassiosira oceanica]|eukprot:EJK52309.1 hypothetical protein THAOC_28431 [Thalassiosira oceanica]